MTSLDYHSYSSVVLEIRWLKCNIANTETQIFFKGKYLYNGYLSFQIIKSSLFRVESRKTKVFPTIMMWLYTVFLLASLQLVSSDVCPKNCVCDVERGLNRASCTHQNIINVGVGVSEDVEIYDLNSNSLHQLEDYCFKVFIIIIYIVLFNCTSLLYIIYKNTKEFICFISKPIII